MINLFRHSKGITGYLIAFTGVGLITFALFPLENHINHTTISLALLLVVLVVATIFGSRPALFASFAGVLSFNFFFLHPVYTFTIDEPQNWVAFTSFFVTAVIAGQLSSYARRRAKESEESRKEIERLYNELQNAFEQASEAEALRRSEQLKSSLLDAVTHDLRTPLTSIKASVTTLIEDRKNNINRNGDYLPLDDEGRSEFLEIIDEETDRLNQFIEGIVGLARIEAGALHLRKSWNQPEEIVNVAIDRAKNRLSKNQILVEIAPELPAVFIDANSISEVVYTLLDNAAKYSPESSRIRVSSRLGGDKSIEISVEDEGKGVSEEMREKVFGKFFRANETDIHTTSSGLGLGLAIARGIVESQGGRIWLEDGRDGYRTKAVFTVPVGEEEN